MVNVGITLKYGMEETVNTHSANDCLNHDCGCSAKVKFKLDSASSLSLLNYNSD